jgi:hypothetical protein
MTEISREAGYDLIARTLLDLTPLRAQPDVVEYLDDRRIVADAEASGVGALPVRAAQRSLIRAVLDRLPDGSRGALVAAGIVRDRYDEFEWPEHRVLIPWRDRRSRITSLQRRTLLSTHPRYVFPRGAWSPREPFGAEHFDSSSRVSVPIVVTEGAMEVFTRRKLAREWGEPRLVLGVPSASILFGASTWLPFLQGRDVFVAFDSDLVGNTAALRFATEMCTGARRVLRERLEGAKDFGEAIHREIIR